MDGKKDWHNCYDLQWSNVIVPEAFSHPAKFSHGLIRRIYQHAFDEGWLKAGDTVFDPFGGVALGSLYAMKAGCHWVGIELEPKFVELGQQNIELWDRTYGPHFQPWGSARLLQGDSRKLGEILGQAGAVVSSPPYAETNQDYANGYKWVQPQGGKAQTNYGQSPGQLAAMPEGSAVVSSPPYETGGHHKHQMDAWNQNGKGQGFTENSFGYGDESEGQVQGNTFWSAAAIIVAQCYQILPAGGVAIWVTKRYVKNGKIVNFSEQWAQLCESVGFTISCWHRSWLIKNKGVKQIAINGDMINKEVQRKSFFRRLHERKRPDLSIDWEDVICMVKE